MKIYRNKTISKWKYVKMKIYRNKNISKWKYVIINHVKMEIYQN